MHSYRSHHCGALNKDHVGNQVRLSGWIHRRRDHGGVLFIDLRDHYGMTQIVVEPENPYFEKLERLRAESVITVDGKVLARSDDTVNPAMPTGEIEIYLSELMVQSEAEELPLPVFAEPDYPEDVRLKYRFLDLRRESLHERIVLRSKIITSIRNRMLDQGFLEYQTPILTASSPEGARDFLVPSRMHPGKFYALPQAPQQFKQLLMISGFDRYFQIAPCFRDEDARADRSPGEFYQLDMEMSYVTQEDVFAAIESVMHGVFEEFAGKQSVTPAPFPRISYADAIRKYGTDKPDLRNPIEMQNVSESFRGSGFKVFASILEKDKKNQVWAIPSETGGSRAFCDRMNGWAQKQGQPGLGYIFWREEDGATVGAGPVAKNIGPERTEKLREQLGLKAGDSAFFCAGNPKDFAAFAAQARDQVGAELELTEKEGFRFCWIVDFPMFQWDEERQKIDFSHNPFSMPQGGLEALEKISNREEAEALLAWQYDIVCNGIELSSGAIRNHRPDIMYKAFEIAGYSRQEVDAEFSGMINALKYGAPPHGGIAPGIDRIVMLLAGAENIREVIPFPLNQQAQDLLMGAPSEVGMQQLRELHIRVVEPAKKN